MRSKEHLARAFAIGAASAAVLAATFATTGRAAAQLYPLRPITMIVPPDLIAGQIDMLIEPQTNVLPLARAGSIKAYAVTARNRSAAAPDIPTADEAGVPGLHVSIWTALFAPKDTPNAVIGKLNAAVVDALADPAVRKRLGDLGLELFPREQQTPEALAAFHQAEIERWWPIIKAAGIKAE